jgi:ricin-type beta-trefoil lectin protein
MAGKSTGSWASLRARRKRGGLELGLVGLVCLLVVGALVGTGLSQTVLATADPLTWLANIRGELTLVNPETGTPVERLQVANAGDLLHVSQGPGGVLVVTNLATNEVTIIDSSIFQIVGSRQGNDGVKILLAGGQIYLVDKVAGQIELLNSLTAATVGQPWRAGAPLADAAVDGRGAVSALDQAGKLVTLEWSGNSFVERDRRDLPQTGATSVLVGNESGVTAVNPNGSISQVGAGEDRTLTAAGLAAPLEVPDRSPASLVPVSSPGSTSVHLVRNDRVVRVDGGGIGCEDPSRPAVYRGRVYVPCHGDGKVVVLDAEGREAEPALPVPGDAELVLNAGLLIVNVPDAETGLVVKPDGTVQEIRTHDPSAPLHDPAARPAELPPDLAQPPELPAEQPLDDGGPGEEDEPAPQPTGGGPAAPRPLNPVVPGPGNPGDPGGPGGPIATIGPGGSPSPATPGPTIPGPGPTPSPSENPAEFTPTGVAALTTANGTVQVSWQAPPNPPNSYVVLRADNLEQVASVGGGGTFADIPGLPPGQDFSFFVEAVYDGDRRFRSGESNPTAAFGLPAGPTVGVQLVARGPDTLTLRIDVGVVDNGGSPISTYDLAVDSSTGRSLENAVDIPIGQNPRQINVDCTGLGDLCLSGGSVTARATLRNAAGAGPRTDTAAGIDPPPQFPFNGSVLIVSTGGKCLDVDLNLHTCSDSAGGQRWSLRSTGDIQNPASGNRCLSTNDGLHLTDDGCSRPGEGADRENRWNLLDGGNTRRIQSQESGRCIFANGDPAGEGVQVRDRGCQFNDQERWTFFTPTLPFTAAQPAAYEPPSTPERPARDGALGGTMTALLLLGLAATALRPRRARGRAR